MRPALCIVVPVFNEAQQLDRALSKLQSFRERGARVVVVDGGSHDDTLAIARAHADIAMLAPLGRAAQMNAGAAACPADVLLFLHADTQLPAHADRLVQRVAQGAVSWGRFDVHIDSDRPMLRIVEWAVNVRSRWTKIATGDQAMFIQHELFWSVGGFPDIALMEDIAISRNLKRHGRPLCLHETVDTSGRRWEQHGVLRTILLMWRLRAAYLLGADPNRLAARYGYQPRQP